MKLGYYLSVFFLVLITAACAQPGGGGGLNISYIRYVNGDTLELTDENLKINHYVMNKKFNKVEFMFPEVQTHKRSYYTGSREWFYLPPDYYEKDYQFCPNQRLEIIYKIDTMTVDFYGIMQENGVGHTEQLDCIDFFPGNYKFHLTESERFDSCWQLRDQFPDQINQLRADMQKGITSLSKMNLKNWHILEEAFNPNVHLIWARYQRENCEETVQGSVENQATRLCEKMMELDETTLHLSTIQKPHMVDDTLTLQYYFYFSFNNRQITSQLDGSNTENILRYPTEERQLAENYLDAFEKKMLFVNGVKYTGTVVLYVNKAKQDLFENSYQEEKHYYFKQGKLLYTYIPFYPPNPEPAEER
jgi:hypothetical protein